MELGISPVLTADYIMHFLTALKIVKCDMSVREDYDKLNLATKVLAMLITIGEAFMYLIGGYFG